MAWEFDSATPLYAQLASRVRADIVCGVYKKGDKLPAVRELALAASVNPNTMQRAFACLEDEGLVITAGTLGRFVTDDDRVIAEARERIASFLVADFARKITGLGYTLLSEPQLWYNASKHFSLGTEIEFSNNFIVADCPTSKQFYVNPTLAVKFIF